MDPIGPGEIGVAVGKAIPAFFSDAFDQFGVGGPQYLATGMPEGIVGQIGQAVGRSACRRYAEGISGLSAQAGQQYENACRPYLDTLNPDDGIVFETPFTGGQCSGAVYLCVVTAQSTSSTSPNISIEFRCLGPVGAAFVEQVSFSPPRANIRMLTGSTVIDSLVCGTVSRPLAPAVRQLNGSQFQGIVTNVQTAVTACGVDNCGDPEPVVRPPGRRIDPTPPPFRFNPGPNIDIPINVDIGPDGDINFDFGGDPIPVDPFEPEPTEPGGGGGEPGDPTDPGSPGSGGDTGAGGDTEGEAPPGQELVGVLVQVLAAPGDANVFDNNAAQPYRGIGYVRMGYPNRLGVDISGGTVISPQFFHAQQRGLTNWAVSANLGFNLRTTPYYRDITE